MKTPALTTKYLISSAALILVTALSACSAMRSNNESVQVNLSGAQEVPAVPSGATGTGTITVANDGSVSVSITTSGIVATAAHIHLGAAGTNGPVIVPFTKTSDNTFAAPAGAKLNEAQMASYKAGGLYVNVHSAKYPGGEIRAQIRP